MPTGPLDDVEREDSEVVEDEQELPGAAQLVQEVRWIRPGQCSLETQDLLLQEEEDMETQGLLTGVTVETQVSGNIPENQLMSPNSPSPIVANLRRLLVC